MIHGEQNTSPFGAIRIDVPEISPRNYAVGFRTLIKASPSPQPPPQCGCALRHFIGNQISFYSLVPLTTLDNPFLNCPLLATPRHSGLLTSLSSCPLLPCEDAP
jgi:hypothetical protein